MRGGRPQTRSAGRGVGAGRSIAPSEGRPKARVSACGRAAPVLITLVRMLQFATRAANCGCNERLIRAGWAENVLAFLRLRSQILLRIAGQQATAGPIRWLNSCARLQ